MVRPAFSSDRGIVDQKHALEAAHVRAQTGLKLPDAAIVATARLADAHTLIGNDRQWRNMPLGVAFLCIDDILMTE
jgi:predicted nucleic acid-binding protein